MFELHARLADDTLTVGEFELCQLLIHKDANYPWFILVPKRPKVTEVYHLSERDRMQLMKESCILAEALVDVFSPDKINIATLGNMVPQLHIHHVARYTTDVAWPNPIWGAMSAKDYPQTELEHRIESVASVLVGEDFQVS
ncbi:MAG TPA: HIT domain-containing protein [Porticoccus sp.]|nr:HIT domain-containing protein [Porticoccus sp.]